METHPLVNAVNQYVARLQRMVEGRKRFFADAAHQLKTPLAIIQAESELALRERELAGARAHLARLNGSVRQAAKEVEQLLSPRGWSRTAATRPRSTGCGSARWRRPWRWTGPRWPGETGWTWVLKGTLVTRRTRSTASRNSSRNCSAT